MVDTTATSRRRTGYFMAAYGYAPHYGVLGRCEFAGNDRSAILKAAEEAHRKFGLYIVVWHRRADGTKVMVKSFGVWR